MEEEKIKQYEELMKLYKESQMVKYGSPDQFQYRQNQLLKELAKFILIPFCKWQIEEEEKNRRKHVSLKID